MRNKKRKTYAAGRVFLLFADEKESETGMSELCIKGRIVGGGRPLVCVPVMEKEKEKIIEEIAYLSESRVDMIEWRVDAFRNFSDYNAVREILKTAAPLVKEKIFLYTFRTQKQGGEADVSAEMLGDLHDLAAESGCVDLVDLEFFAENHSIRKIRKLKEQGVKIIASHHDFEETPAPEVMQMLLEKMCAGGADIVKLAVMPKSEQDVLALLDVTSRFWKENPDTPVITMSMGKLGSISRLCGETFGSCVTFGAHKVSSAPGQLEMNRLADILDIIHESNAGVPEQQEL